MGTDTEVALDDDAETPMFSDDELAELALALPFDRPPDPEARSFYELTGSVASDLPSWYMPVVPGGSRRLKGWRRRVAWTLVVGFLAINAAGLCSTYGSVVPAW